MKPDNFLLSVEGHGFEDFERAIQIAFDDEKATHYKRIKGFIWLYPQKEKDSTELPFPLTSDQAITFLWSWLNSLGREDMPPPPDIDGDIKPDGWKVLSGAGGGIVQVNKAWSIYHK